MKFAIGFVMYYPDMTKLKETLQKFSKYSHEIVLYNNGLKDNDLDFLKNLSVNVIGTGKNVGIAKALNEIMRYARDYYTADWVFVSDQDAGYIGNVFEEYSKYADDPEIGVICPSIVKKLGGKQPVYNLVNGYEEVQRCPTSGMAMRISDWEAVDGYNDDLFIDYVDYDMCEKIILLDKKLIRLKSVILVQSLGKSTKISWMYQLGTLIHSKRIETMATVFNHSPKRNYYFVRNGIIYVRTYHNEIHVLSELKFIFKWELKKLIFERNKIKQFMAFINGLIAGVKFEVQKVHARKD